MAALSGMDQIVDYCQKKWGWSKHRVRLMITVYGFPATKLGGGWESDSDLIDKWYPLIIEKMTIDNNSNNEN